MSFLEGRKRLRWIGAGGIAVAMCAAFSFQSVRGETYTWVPNADGFWSDTNNWNPNTAFPNAAGDVANLTTNLSGSNKTVTLDIAATIGVLNLGDEFGTPWRTFNLTGFAGTPLTFDNAGANAQINKSRPTNNDYDTISAPIVLAADLDINSSSPAGGILISGEMSETGGSRALNVSGTSLVPVILSGVNTYSGPTTINSSSLLFNKRVSFYNDQQGPLAGAWNANNLVVNSGGTAAFSVGAADEFTVAEVQGFMAMSTAIGGFKDGSSVGFDTTNVVGGLLDYTDAIVDVNGGANQLGLTKYGAGTMKLSGANTYSGPTVVGLGGGVLHFANRQSFYNDTPAMWTADNLIVNPGWTPNLSRISTAAFSLGGVDGFTLEEINNFRQLATDTSGFLNGSLVGIDTTNAGANTDHSYTLEDPNAGANRVGLHKLGDNTLTLIQGGALAGDYNMDGSVNAADYVVWRDQDSTGGAYTTWYNNFGASGAGNSPNTYTGSTIVDGGTLRVERSHTLVATNVAGSTGNYIVGSTADASGEIIIDLGAGAITSDQGMMIGESGTGMGTLESGTITVKADNNGGGQFFGVGRFAGSNGTWVQNGGDIFVGATGNNDWFVVGVSGTGDVTLNDGTINSSTFGIAQNGGSAGTFTMNGGTVNTSANLTIYSGDGTINLNDGEINLGTWMTLGENASSNSTLNMTGGTITSSQTFVLAYRGNTTANISGGTVTANNQFWVGVFGIAELNQSGGTMSTSTFMTLGEAGTGVGTYNMTGGTMTTGSAMVLGYQGQGFVNQEAGDITVGHRVVVGQTAGGQGQYIMDGGTLTVGNQFYVAWEGLGTFDLRDGTVTLDSVDGDVRVGDEDLGQGTLTQSGGAIVTGDWTYIARDGQGTYNLSGGTFEAGDNFSIALNVTTLGMSQGTMNMTGGTVTVIGNEPSYTGNFLVSRNGNGVLNMSSGLIDLVVGDTGTNHSITYSIAQGAENPLAFAQDGNFIIAEETGTGLVDQSGDAVINVAANVVIGGVELDAANANFMIGGNGTLTIRDNAEMHVGVTSPSGGDMVLGSPATVSPSTATVNLQGGLLDMTHNVGAHGGTIGSGGAGSITAFNFTGGTLKFRQWNPLGPFGGDLGNLVQNGSGSLLEVTNSDTTIVRGSYDLGEGTATIGDGRTLAVSDGNILNSAGAGVISVGQGGATAMLDVGAGTIDVDTLNLDNGNVVGSLATVRTALNGGGSFSNDLTLDAASATTLEINSSSDFDVIDVANLLSVGGTLDLTVGFTPGANEMFDILDFGSIAGTFSSVNFSTGTWDTSNLYTTGVVTYLSGGAGAGAAVPEPATWSLMAIALAGLFGARSVRNRRK